MTRDIMKVAKALQATQEAVQELTPVEYIELMAAVITKYSVWISTNNTGVKAIDANHGIVSQALNNVFALFHILESAALNKATVFSSHEKKITEVVGEMVSTFYRTAQEVGESSLKFDIDAYDYNPGRPAPERIGLS